MPQFVVTGDWGDVVVSRNGDRYKIHGDGYYVEDKEKCIGFVRHVKGKWVIRGGFEYDTLRNAIGALITDGVLSARCGSK